jgi:hypothetical protein
MNKKQLIKELKKIDNSETVILSDDNDSYTEGPFIMIHKTMNEKYIVGLCSYNHHLDEFLLARNPSHCGGKAYIFSFDKINDLVSFLPFYFISCIFKEGIITLLNDSSLKMCDYNELYELYKKDEIKKLDILLHKYWNNNTLHLNMKVFKDN